MAAPKSKTVHSYKQVDGQEVRPIYYYSRSQKFMAAVMPNGNLVERNGEVVPYKAI